ncbi:high affinity immunoglobulin alpha and immunoglobulin mu Fc receptor isoform a [Daubentonia madagascariensis]
MDGEAPQKPKEQKEGERRKGEGTSLCHQAHRQALPPQSQVANQRAGWKMALLLTLCLLPGSSLSPPHRGPHLKWLWDGSLPSRTHLWAGETPSSPLCWRESSFAAANALKGPKLVSGEPGGAVTIQCHYAPSLVNRHQRKYWCRLRPPKWICHTIVSTNHYTHHRYHGRVALADFPQRGFFVVRLSRLSLDDVGCYHCGIGDGSTMLFFGMNLTVSAVPFQKRKTALTSWLQSLPCWPRLCSQLWFYCKGSSGEEGPLKRQKEHQGSP